ncbi:MAG TPA: ABC transporter permease [Bacilli bacterium]|nr:ABC transporter permease [Bacilli bacterium]
MKRFISDIKKYFRYIAYDTKATLKAEITDSYLGWIWLILEPLCFMLIYFFIGAVVFKSKLDYFPVFVFIGLSIWNFFNKTVVQSVKLVQANKETVTKVYLPKFILLFVQLGVGIVKMAVSFALVIIFMLIYQIPISWNVLYFIPILLVLFILTFGIGTIFMHFGVFASDLTNLTNIAFKLLFYLSGIFYDLVGRVPAPYNAILLYVNPIAYLIDAARQVLMYQSTPNFLPLLIWFVIGIILSIIGINTIYKYENTYVKVMR